jgi:methanethiol S-methyltransferase
VIREVWSYYGRWGTAGLWTILLGAFLLFLPLHRRVQRKPAGIFLAFAAAYALEMYGTPFSLYLVVWGTGRYLPVGVLWGHTLSAWIGMTGHYIYLAFLVIGGSLIVAGWERIYYAAWCRPESESTLMRSKVYRYLRHPQYVGLLLVSLGAIIDWATLPLLILWPVLVRQYVMLAAREERALEAKYGELWREYAAQTGRFFPRMLRRARRPQKTAGGCCEKRRRARGGRSR